MHSHTESQLKNVNDNFLEVGVIGRTVGLNGALKFHNKSDFPQQFKRGNKFYLKNLDELVIKSYDNKRDLIVFENFEDINIAKKLTNKVLYSTKSETIKNCKLAKDEYFYFDVIGLDVFEDDELLGTVIDIMEVSIGSLLQISTTQILVNNALPKEFFIPYIDRYIQRVDLSQKRIIVKNSKDILLNS